MSVKIEALSITVEAFKSAACEIQISGKLCDMLAAGTDADMQAVCPRFLHLFRDRDGFLYGIVRIVISQILVILFHTVDQYLNDVVLAYK